MQTQPYEIKQILSTGGVPLAAGLDAAFTLESIGGGTFSALITPDWHVVRGPHGGYLAALLLEAMTRRQTDPGRRARVLSAHYLSVPATGPIEVRTSVLREGRSVTWLGAELARGDQVFVTARAAFSREWSGVEYAERRAPELPPPELGVPMAGNLPMPPFTRHFDYRSFFSLPGAADGSGLVGGYIRPRVARAYDAPLLAALSDAWFPTTFAHDPRMVMGATMDLTVHFRDVAALDTLAPGEFLRSVFRSTVAHEGFFEEDGELWSNRGELLVQSRQLAVGALLAA